MRKILIFWFLITTNCIAQNSMQLLLLQRDGKLNLVPRYGFGLVEKNVEEKDNDTKFTNEITKQCASADSASRYLSKKGYYYFSQGDIWTAMKRFNQAWLLDSTNALVYYGFSSVLKIVIDNPTKYFDTWRTQIDKVEEPQKYYEMGLKKDSDRRNEKYSLMASATGYEKFGKLSEAIEACTKLLEYNSNDTLTLCYRGHLYTLNGEWSNAIADIEKSFPKESHNSNILNDLGFSYDQLGDYKNAALNYEKASQISPKFLNPIYNHAIMKMRIGEYQSALENIEKCIGIRDDVGDFYRTKGEILLKLNSKEEAIKNLKKAKKLGDKEAQKKLDEIK